MQQNNKSILLPAGTLMCCSYCKHLQFEVTEVSKITFSYLENWEKIKIHDQVARQTFGDCSKCGNVSDWSVSPRGYTWKLKIIYGSLGRAVYGI